MHQCGNYIQQIIEVAALINTCSCVSPITSYGAINIANLHRMSDSIDHELLSQPDRLIWQASPGRVPIQTVASKHLQLVIIERDNSQDRLLRYLRIRNASRIFWVEDMSEMILKI